MKQKKEFFYTLAIVLFILCIWSILFFIPRVMALQTLEEEFEQYNTKMTVALEGAKNSEQLAKRINDLDTAINKMRNKLIQQSSINQIAEIIRKEFKKYNVKINEISPVLRSYLDRDRDKGKDSYYRLPIEMKLEANFMDFVKLLENTENLVFFINPDQISLYKVNDNTKTLMIDFRASVYILNGSII